MGRKIRLVQYRTEMVGNKLKILFLWQGLDDNIHKWDDGLRRALQRLEQMYDIIYWDAEDVKMITQSFDVILYWEAPITIKGKNQHIYRYIQGMKQKKALLFAGGRIEKDWVKEFDLLFVESDINEKECATLGIPWMRAFGINEEIMVPVKQPKIWDGIMQATFAGWKRHELFADALGEKGLVVGRKQQQDLNGYNHCLKKKVMIIPEVQHDILPSLIGASHAVVNTSEFWGGGQRCTLEGMACDVPVIVMSDSPKNCEYVRESGAGIICEPNQEAIRAAVAEVKSGKIKGGREYIESKWSSKHYAMALHNGIMQILQ